MQVASQKVVPLSEVGGSPSSRKPSSPLSPSRLRSATFSPVSSTRDRRRTAGLYHSLRSLEAENRLEEGWRSISGQDRSVDHLTRAWGSAESLDPADRPYAMAMQWLEPTPVEVHTRRAARFVAGAIESILRRDLGHRQLSDGEILNHLLGTLAAGSDFTYRHSLRVMDMALKLCRELGIEDPEVLGQVRLGSLLKDIGQADYLLSRAPAEYRQRLSRFLASHDLHLAGMLHDIGKLRVPDAILHKPGKLTEEEFEVVKMHPVWGEQLLDRFPSLRHLCPVVRGHHERWDGRGYPDGLAGEEIPLAARIIALADVFDALHADRPYRRGLPTEEVLVQIERAAGTHFDPALVPAFLRVVRRQSGRPTPTSASWRS